MEKIVRVGVAIIVVKQKRVLLGKRKGSHGSGTWAFPGGHMNYGESITQTARRELFEETGLCAKEIIIGPYTNDLMENENKHYITLFTLTHWNNREPELKEPNKCETWEWFEWNNLPTPLFTPLLNLKETGYSPFDEK